MQVMTKQLGAQLMTQNSKYGLKADLTFKLCMIETGLSL